jgi:hypothetical protein
MAGSGYGGDMDDAEQEALREGLKTVAVALKESGVPFALVGGYAAWVHGAPEPGHDVDFLVSESDARRAAEELDRRDLSVRQPPEDWLFKVEVDGVTVDVIHRTSGPSITEVLEGASRVEVLSVEMPVASATDVTTEKLLAMDEHFCDLGAILPTLRALREQVDWDEVRRQVAGAPFAETVLFLLERLEVISPAG